MPDAGPAAGPPTPREAEGMTRPARAGMRQLSCGVIFVTVALEDRDATREPAVDPRRASGPPGRAT